MKIAVITSSDRAYQNIYADQSGIEIQNILRIFNQSFEIFYRLVPDSLIALRSAFQEFQGCDWIITTGGTGISERDVTVEATKEFCDYEIPGISEYLRRESFQETPFAVFSRGYVGYYKKCIVVNLPGSLAGATFYTRLLLPLLIHGTKMINGAKH